jgi:hypothetical protein
MTPTTSPARRRKLLSLSIAATLAVTLAACGSDDDNAAIAPPASADGTAVAATIPGMRPPVPIQVASGSAGVAAASGTRSATSASPEMAADMSMIAPYYISEFVLAEGFPALPTNNVGFVFDGDTDPTDEQITALAAAFGVEGEVVVTDQNGFRSWQVGPTDGTAPTIYVSGDSQISWSYSPAWAENGDVAVSCVYVDPAVGSTGAAEETTDGPTDSSTVGPAEVQPTAGTDVAVPQEVCEEPEPPANVPTAEAAEALAVEQLTDLGVDVSTLTFDTYADEWSASVTATVNRNGSPTGQTYSFGYGAEGALQWAGGSLATPTEVGPYDLIDVDTALARLVEMNAWQAYPTDMLARDSVVAEGDPATDVATQPETGSGVAGNDGSTEPGVAPATTQVDTPTPVEPMPVETSPVEPMPVETFPVDSFPVETYPAPEARTVTLVDVEADVWWAWDVDNVLWLLPAYRFIDTDGGWHVVPAVTDEFLIEVEQPVMVEEPAEDPTEMPAEFDVTSFEGLVGLPIDEFTKQAEAIGASVRVTEIDGQPQAMTMDYRFDRINVAVTTTDGVQIVTGLNGLG